MSDPAWGVPAKAIPVARTHPLARPLRVVRDVPAPRFATRAIFLHIPKTAGRTMLSILTREYEGLPSMGLYEDQDIMSLMSMSSRRRRGLRLVTGHIAFGAHEVLPGPSTYLTMLRDPVERIVSHYHYLRSRPTDDNHAQALDGVETLDDYVRSSAHAQLVNNGQTRLLGSAFNRPDGPADDEALLRAKKVLERDDVVFGLQERFDESVLLMMNTLGWGHPAYGVENRTVDRTSVDTLSPETIDLIKKHNRLDLELHEYAVNLFEKHLSLVLDLEEELELLRLAARYRATGS